MKMYITDQEYIQGLKSGEERIIHHFFYDLCHYMISDIRISLFHNVIDYDEMVNELYLYLSADNWRRLDTFCGLNGCHLQTWMVKLGWRYFMHARTRLLNCADGQDEIESLENNNIVFDLSVEIKMDVERVFALMPNKRYVRVLELMFIQGYDAQETAAELNTSSDNIYNIKHRAIMQFIQVYGEKNWK